MALSILRTATQQAHREYADWITNDIIAAAMPQARAERHQKDVETLTPHQRTLYEINEEPEEIVPSELYKEYRKQMDDPKTDRTVQNYLSKMDQYDIIQAESTSRVRTYHSVSETFDLGE